VFWGLGLFNILLALDVVTGYGPCPSEPAAPLIQKIVKEGHDVQVVNSGCNSIGIEVATGERASTHFKSKGDPYKGTQRPQGNQNTTVSKRVPPGHLILYCSLAVR
jgi:hypothetical protein